jgi:hypothetical protein
MDAIAAKSQQSDRRTQRARANTLSKSKSLKDTLLGGRPAAEARPHAPAPVVAPVQVTRIQDDYEHIMLHSTSIPAIMRWTKDIESYTARTGIVLQLGLRISKSVRHDLMARNALTMTSEAIFYHLPEDEILNAIQALVRPQSRFAAANMLDTLVVFSIPKTFVLTPSNYADFYPFLLAYNEKFRRLIAYLGYDNAENLPVLRKDRPGLLFFYLRAIPFQFGWSTFANLDRKHFDSLEQFFEVFMQQPSEMYAFAIVWQKHMAVLAYSEQSERYATRDRERDAIPTRAPPVPPPAAATRTWNGRATANAVHALQEDQRQESVAHAGGHDPDSRHDARMCTDELEQAGDKDLDLKSDRSIPAHDEEELDFHRLQALDGRPPSSGRLYDPSARRLPPSNLHELPCYEMVNKGSCSRDKCSYSHDKRVIAKAKAKNTLRNAEKFNKGFPP